LSIYLLWIYLCVGPLAWVLLYIGTRFSRARTKRLESWKAQLPPEPPYVTILIPAKDEGAGIQRCLKSIFAQDYPSFDVIAIDDRSADDTGTILDALAVSEPRLTVLHIQPGALPEGWLGKCHALHAAHEHLAGPIKNQKSQTKNPPSSWLFFVDSDVTLEPHALSTALSMAIQRGYDALTIFTRIETHSFLERLMLPPLAAAWVIMYTASLTNEDSRKNIAVANGQFFLIRREAYEAVGGHAAVRNQITEDVELMRLLKSRDYKVRIFSGAHLAATRMHSSLRQMFHGWARIFSGTSRRNPRRIIGAIIFILASVLMVYPALGWGIARALHGEYLWLTFSLVHFLLMTGYFMRVYRWSGNPMRSALLVPVSAVLMLAILVYALRKCQTGRILWRDTEFAAAAPVKPDARS
jgi:cellulose synthase/poly-beta-1,6-N-acetylglucosamine synthase-like glycosyltransferase